MQEFSVEFAGKIARKYKLIMRIIYYIVFDSVLAQFELTFFERNDNTKIAVLENRNINNGGRY